MNMKERKTEIRFGQGGALNYEKMLYESTSQIKLCLPKYHDLLFAYRNYVSNIPTSRGTASNRTILHHIKTISMYLRQQKIKDVSQIKPESVRYHLKRYKRPKNVISVIRRFSNFLLDQGLISEERFKEIQKIKVRTLHRPGDSKKFSIPIERWPEILTLPNIKKTPPRRFAVWLALNFGLRLGEILHLTVDDIKLNQNNDSYFYIRANKDIKYDDWEPKTNSSNRRIYITPQQEKTFKKYLTIRENKQSPYLIYNQGTRRKQIPVLEGTFAKIFDNCYLDFFEHEQWVKRKLRFHVLRYSSAVFYYFKTKDIFFVSKLLGHSSIKQTEEYLGLTEQQIFDGLKGMMTRAWTL